jgi:hypothetical protein
MQDKELDSFEKKLQESIKTLQDCQNSHSLKSCFDCDKFLDCGIRDEYVQSVYKSMNKGKGGGFEF